MFFQATASIEIEGAKITIPRDGTGKEVSVSVGTQDGVQKLYTVSISPTKPKGISDPNSDETDLASIAGPSPAAGVRVRQWKVGPKKIKFETGKSPFVKSQMKTAEIPADDPVEVETVNWEVVSDLQGANYGRVSSELSIAVTEDDYLPWFDVSLFSFNFRGTVKMNEN
jgi:hypothetical protein